LECVFFKQGVRNYAFSFIQRKERIPIVKIAPVHAKHEGQNTHTINSLTMMYPLKIIPPIASPRSTLYTHLHFLMRAIIAIMAIIGYTTIAISEKGIQKIRAKFSLNTLLQEKRELISQ